MNIFLKFHIGNAEEATYIITLHDILQIKNNNNAHRARASGICRTVLFHGDAVSKLSHGPHSNRKESEPEHAPLAN